MPGLMVEAEKKLLEDDPLVDEDDVDDSEEDYDTEDSDDDKEDGAEEPTIREQLAELKREIADFRMMVADNIKQILLMLEALPDKVSEILAQRLAGPFVCHEPGPTSASTMVDTVACNPDSTPSSPAPAADAPPATTGCTPDRTPAFLVPDITAAVVTIPSIEAGDTHMPDAAA